MNVPKIKIAPILSTSTYKRQFAKYTHKLIHQLHQQGVVQLVDDVKQCECIVVSDKSQFQNLPDTTKVIYISLTDSVSSLGAPRFDLMLVPLVYTDHKQYNLPQINGRRHVVYYAENNNMLSKVESHINQHQLDFNRLVLCIPQFQQFIPRPIKKTKPLKQRSIDLMFFGKMLYGPKDNEDSPSRLITHHRTKCVEKLNKLSNNYTVSCKAGKIPFDKYCSKLANSKILVSPFGYGEWSIKTYEAIAHGCIPIVPLGKLNIQTVPDVYETLPHCDMNFNNLDKVVKQVLDNLPYWQKIIDQLRALIYNDRQVNKACLNNLREGVHKFIA